MRRGGNENLRPGARLFEFVRAETAGDLDEEASLAQRGRLLGILGRETRPAHLALALWGGLGVLVAIVTAARVGHATPWTPGFAVRDRVQALPAASGADDRPDDNGYVSAKGSTPTVRFAGASHIDFASGSRARIGELSPTRARVVLEGGEASVHSEAHPPEGFLVEAGPYALRGGRSAFDVSWSGSVLHVRVASGAVVVEGPAAREGLTLREDQSFEACDANEDIRCF
jgi:hypothetical protein